jgi:catechol 2,3-dioxygenase-like lactoylglutathione lyase family enzyme
LEFVSRNFDARLYNATNRRVKRQRLSLEKRMRPQPLICVRDVEASSRWYQYLLGCQSAHGGPNYERLVRNHQLVLQLHRWEEEHHHGPIGDVTNPSRGNGVLLWFEIDDFDEAVKRVAALNPEILLPRHRNPPEGDGGPNHWEIWIRDPDGYKVVLASPDGTADGNWRPGDG